MKIAHVGPASFYTDGMTYQDNQLAEQNVRDGHQVLYISNAAKYVDGHVVETGYEDKILPSGVRLVRLPYQPVLTPFISGKVRKVKGLYPLLDDFAPDVILSHDLCYWSVLDVIRYKKDHPEVKFYADTHTAIYNSGTNWLSLHVQHRIFYRYLTQKALPYLEKVLYVGASEADFVAEHYGVPRKMLEFYPLGGYVLPEGEHAEKRLRRRNELGIGEDELLFVHSGKLDAQKRTKELLEAFAAVPELKAKLVVIGVIPETERPALEPLMEADNRVVYLGWKQSEELVEYLCACDLYCQPGSVSATMQNAVCCGCPVMSYPHLPYRKDLDFGNILWVKTREDMEDTFRNLADRSIDLQVLRAGSEQCARQLLDYRALAARLYR